MPKWLIVLCCFALAGCEADLPPTQPKIETPAGSGTINGTERIAWDQPAASAAELGKIGYVIYVDAEPTTLDSVSCEPSQTTTRPVSFACSAPLPALTSGPHILELASFVKGTPASETGRSAPVRVIVKPVAAPTPQTFNRATSFSAGSAVTA